MKNKDDSNDLSCETNRHLSTTTTTTCPMKDEDEDDRTIVYTNVNLKTIVFGSCHKNEFALQQQQQEDNSSNNRTIIWDIISQTVNPDVFLWTGDTVYLSSTTTNNNDTTKKRNNLEQLKWEYQQMLYNTQIGYSTFLSNHQLYQKGGVHGTWDDHDYGTNDGNKYLTNKYQRQTLYHQFLSYNLPSITTTTTDTHTTTHNHNDHPISTNTNYYYDKYPQKNSVYKSILYKHLDDNNNNNDDDSTNFHVKVIFLDTRSGMDSYCPIPGIIGNKIPLAALISCFIRWISATFWNKHTIGFLYSSSFCSNQQLLDHHQWSWLERQLLSSSSSSDNDTLHIIVSSIQVLTTNPLVESWGHFPYEKQKLLQLLNHKKGILLLSGDVHHAELSSTLYAMKDKQHNNNNDILEVTSSGLTHSCTSHSLIGKHACQPILNTYTQHRYSNKDNFSTKRNFGSIDILSNKNDGQYNVTIYDDQGTIALQTGPRSIHDQVHLSNEEIHQIAFHFSNNTTLLHSLPLYMISIIFFLLILNHLLSLRKKKESYHKLNSLKTVVQT